MSADHTFKVFLIYSFSILLAACGGGGGGGAQSSSVSQQQTVQTAPSVSFSSSQSQPEQESDFRLTWSSSNATTCTASGDWSGGKASSGDQTITASNLGNLEYSLTCSNSVGDTVKTVQIEVVEKTFQISGSLKVSSFTELDGDVPSEEYPVTDNDDAPQVIENPTQLVGYVTDEADGDEYDLYQVSLVGNQWVGLEIANYDEEDPNSVDLDILILNEEIETVDYGVSTESFEQVGLPSSGEYYIAVYAESGASRYVLTVSNRISSYSLSNYSSNVSVVPEAMSVSRVRLNSKSRENPKFRELSGVDLDLIRELDLDLAIEPSTHTDTRINRQIGKETRQEVTYLEKLRRVMGKRSDFLTQEIQEQILTKKYIARKSQVVEGLMVRPQFKLSEFGFQKDPYFNYQWNYQQIGLRAALESLNTNQTNKVVAVIDSGTPPIDSKNYSETAYLQGGYDFVDGDDDPTASVKDELEGSYYAHGIHVSGIIAAKNDGLTLNGMGVRVLPIRTSGKGGSDPSAVVNALKYASGQSNSSGKFYDNSGGDLVAVNLSLGACVASSESLESLEICDAIEEVRGKGIAVVAAAGNCICNGEFSELFCQQTTVPAACPGVISVAAVDTQSTRANYSSYHSTVDIAAPGGDSDNDLNSDGYPDGVPSYVNKEDVQFLQGTSMAAPHVAGTIALMKHANPDLSPNDIDSLLQGGHLTNTQQNAEWTQEAGYGILDVSKSIESAAATYDAVSLVAVPSFSPTEYDFGFSEDVFTLTMTKIGTGDLSVVDVLAEIPEHLTYIAEASSDTDVIGKYTFSLKRSEIPDGSIRNAIYFLMNDGNYYGVPLRYSTGSPRSAPNIGNVYLGIYEVNKEEWAQTYKVDLSSGSSSYVFTGLSEGNYEIWAFTDIDSNFESGLVGEIMGVFPDISDGTGSVTLDEDKVNVNLTLKPLSGFRLGALTAFQTSNSEQLLQK